MTAVTPSSIIRIVLHQPQRPVSCTNTARPKIMCNTTTFHSFPLLPPHLRKLLWSLTVEPRTVDVQVTYTNYIVRPKARSSLVSSTPISVPLRTCPEAQNLGLYQRAFSKVTARCGAEPRWMWVYLKVDMISIGTTSFAALKPVAPSTQRLRVERANSDESWSYFEASELQIFVNAGVIHVIFPRQVFGVVDF